MRKPRKSYQTAGGSFFAYNPLRGANINVWASDRTDKPRTLILETHPLEPNEATALGGRLHVKRTVGGQFVVTLLCRDGIVRNVERFSLVFPGRAKKRVFAST